MNKVQLRLEINKLQKQGHCGPKCKYFGKLNEEDGRCFNLRSETTGVSYRSVSRCKVSALVFRNRVGLDSLFEKDKNILENLQYSTEKDCRTCANIMCFNTHAKGLNGPCKYWKPQILLDYPEIPKKIKLEGITKHPKKVGQIGYSFGGSLNDIQDLLELSVSIGTFSRGMTGGNYVYKFYSKNITTRPFFYTLEEFGYE